MMDDGNVTPGRKRLFSRARAMLSTTSASRAHKVTLRPALAATSASAVPQAPAPTMAMDWYGVLGEAEGMERVMCLADYVRSWFIISFIRP